MAINMENWRREFNAASVREAMSKEYDRWERLTPEQRKAEEKGWEAKREKVRKHIAFLDYCVAKKIDPNLVKDISK